MEYLLEVEGLWKKYSRDLKASVKYSARQMLRLSFGLERQEIKLRDTYP